MVNATPNSANISMERTSSLQPFTQGANVAEIQTPEVNLKEVLFGGKITLVASPRVADGYQSAVEEVLGLSLPLAGQYTQSIDGAVQCMWLTPNDYIITCMSGDEEALLTKLQTAIADFSAIAYNATDRLQQAIVTGEKATDLLNKGCALDFNTWSKAKATRCKFAAFNLVIQQTGAQEFQIFWDACRSVYAWEWFKIAMLELV